jgi:PAS domain S-box-containing protein
VYHREHDLPIWSPGDRGETPQVEEATAPDESRSGMWRDVVEATPGFVMLLNRDYVCTYVTPSVESQIGMPPDAVIGMRPETVIAPDQLADVWRGRAAMATGERGVTNRVRVVGGSGGQRWYESSATQLVDPKTQSVYSAVHVRDVTTEVESQETLSRVADRYRCVISAIDEAVLQLDAQGRIESYNEQAVQLVCRTAEELLGATAVTLLDLRDQDGRPAAGPLTETLAGSPGTGAGVWRSIVRGDGQRRLVRIKLASFDGPGPSGGGNILLLKESGSAADGAVPAPTLQQARSAAGLTAREGDVLDGLAAGGDVPTIARQLGISVHSVRGHVKSITAKLGVHSQLQAVIAAAQRGMIDLGRRG